MSEQNPNPSNNNFPNMKPNNQKPNRWRWVSWLLYSVAFFLLAIWMFGGDAGSAASKELSYTKFVAYIENDAVKDITVYDDNRAGAGIATRGVRMT